jgi:hypothetical protein
MNTKITLGIAGGIIVLVGIILYLVNFKNSSDFVPAESLSQPETENIADQKEIKAALEEKHGLKPGEIAVVMDESDGKYATGSVGSVKPGPGGGMWFATKIDGEWKIVWDGNGAVMCSDLIGFEDFPTRLISECYDGSTGTMIER